MECLTGREPKMRRTAIVVAALLWTMPAAADEWTSTDTAFQLTVASLQIVDVMQTHWGIDNGFRESNPFLGPHPSHARLNLMVGGAIIGHALVAWLLPQPWRRSWQVVGIIAEVGAVSNNVTYTGGIKLSLRF